MLAGPIPVLLTAWLLCHADDVALFQDGSFQPRLSIEVIERLIKAPSRFSIRFVGVAGARKRVLDRLSQTIEPRHLGPDVRNATRATGPRPTRVVGTLVVALRENDA